MSEPQFELSGLSFAVQGPDFQVYWPDIVALRQEAFAAALPHRTQEEIGFLTQAKQPLLFRQACVDPHTSVTDGRLYEHQSFANLTMATVHDGDSLVAFGYAADNVSGRNAAERWVKMKSTAKRYAWLREVVVHPDVQNQGVGSTVVALLLDNFVPEQPVSAYTWLENKSGTAFVKSLGLEPTKNPKTNAVIEETRQVFGPDTDVAWQTRWSDKSVREVQSTISEDSVVEAAIKHARLLATAKRK